MSRLRVAAFGGLARRIRRRPRPGPGPSARTGRRSALPQWFFPTRTFKRMHDGEDGTTAWTTTPRRKASTMSAPGSWGATCSGRCAGPGPMRAGAAGGARSRPITSPPSSSPTTPAAARMAGGTIFHFVTGGIDDALARAREAAAGRDVRIGGGAATIRQYLKAGLIDELRLAIVPVLMGKGEKPVRRARPGRARLSGRQPRRVGSGRRMW